MISSMEIICRTTERVIMQLLRSIKVYRDDRKGDRCPQGL